MLQIIVLNFKYLQKNTWIRVSCSRIKDGLWVCHGDWPPHEHLDTTRYGHISDFNGLEIGNGSLVISQFLNKYNDLCCFKPLINKTDIERAKYNFLFIVVKNNDFLNVNIN